MGTPAPDVLLRLIDRFDSDRKVFLSGDYKEEQLRAEFLNPFFTALGWDMDKTLDTIQNRNRGSIPLIPRLTHRSLDRFADRTGQSSRQRGTHRLRHRGIQGLL
jgi:hypothetical protein